MSSSHRVSNVVLAYLLVVCIMCVGRVAASPWQRYAVELTACSAAEADLPSEKCITICQPIRHAQEKCERGIACTCSTAPPQAIEACLSCNMASQEDRSQQSVLVARAISSYAELCGDPSLQPLTTVPETLDTNATTISRREASPSSCVFGLPDISNNALLSEVAIVMGHQNLLVGMLVFVIVALCAIARRFK